MNSSNVVFVDPNKPPSDLVNRQCVLLSNRNDDRLKLDSCEGKSRGNYPKVEEIAKLAKQVKWPLDSVVCFQPNPLSATRALRSAIETVQSTSDNCDLFSKLYDATKEYAEQVVGPRSPADKSYKLRLFADLHREYFDRPETAERTDDRLLLYAKGAVEIGSTDEARKWYLRLLLNTSQTEPDYWLTYATFCLRRNDFDIALQCATKAIRLDGKNVLAIFLYAAVCVAKSDRFDECEAHLKWLITFCPKFSEAYYLLALHCHLIDMPDLAKHYVEISRQCVYDRVIDEDHPINRFAMSWLPVDHNGSAEIKCSALLLKLQLVELAKMCLSGIAETTAADSYHYLMAVVHFESKQFHSSVDHLNAMTGQNTVPWLTLAGHCEYELCRQNRAMEHYDRVVSIASNSINHLVHYRMGTIYYGRRQYDAAADIWYRSYGTAPTPIILEKLAACLIRLNCFGKAEKVLLTAVAIDGENGNFWRYLSIVNAKLEKTDMARKCYEQAIRLGFNSDLEPPIKP